ncbi:MAG: tRNA lysidine(34) synthetase TilS [Treponema sp.]|nr:tRNA lysidine(34) synthetase TilS [Treponema sp.]
MEKIVREFEETVLKAFTSANLVPTKAMPLRIGAGVSGGADSVSMLLSLVHLFGSGRVFVLTVNHHMRQRSESDGDCFFVRDLCGRLGVQCKIAELAEGGICARADERGLGLEEAARFERYRAFDEFIAQEKLDVFCLAHNQNDQLETVLMRFLQGVDGSISRRRGVFFRPLLSVTRPEIESYLRAQNVPWRTDSTNGDNSYYRNRVRNRLVPCLDELFPGWRRGVLSLAEKNEDDAAFFSDVCAALSWERCGSQGDAGAECVCMDAELFFSQKAAVRRRLIFRAFSLVNAKARISYRMVRPILFWRDDSSVHRVFGAGVCVWEERASGGRKIFVSRKDTAEKDGPKIVESGFYFLIRDKDALKAFSLSFYGEEKMIEIPVPFPFVIRSFFGGDKIVFSNGRTKSVAHYFSEQKIPREKRGTIPFLQEISAPSRVFLLSVGGSG